MQQNHQLQITRTQLFSSKTQSKSIVQLIESLGLNYKNSESFLPLTTIKIMYSDKLCDLNGIAKFKNVSVLNLNCNKLREITQISKLQSLRQLNISSNSIDSLNGLSNCVKLQKVNLSNNLIRQLDQFRKMRDNGNALLVEIDLSNNKIDDEKQIINLKGFNSLKTVYFEKKNATNTVCVKRKQQYYQSISRNLIENCGDSIRIDGKSAFQIMKILATLKQKNIPHRDQQEGSYQQESINVSNKYYQQQQQQQQQQTNVQTRKQYPMTTNLKQSGNSINRKRNSQLEMQYQTILNHKDDIIEDLKNKIYDLQISNAQQYKDLIKKQAQTERIYGQLSQLGKQVDNKQSKLNQSHKRLQKMLESCSQANKSIEHKNSQLQNLQKNINQLKIQNAEYKALNKNYDKRMSDLHQKAYDNAEERVIRSQQLKRQNKQLYEQNMSLLSDVNSLKQRNRELTELLRQWDYKYQSKITEVHRIYEEQKLQIINELQGKLTLEVNQHEQQINQMTESFNQQLKGMQNEYQKVLEQSLAKYKSTKFQLDQKKQQQKNMKSFRKQMQEKLREKQDVMGQLQGALRSLKKQFQNVFHAKQRLSKQLHSFRLQKEDSQRRMSEQLSRVSYQRNSIQKNYMNLKQTNISLQLDNERLTEKQKQLQNMQSKVEDLQTRVTSQQHMLEDKNNTIEELKVQLQLAHQSQQNKGNQQKKQLTSLRSKYDKSKQRRQELMQANQLLVEQKQRLQDQLQNARIDKNDYATLQSEILNFQNIIDDQQKSITQKRLAIQSLIKTIEECRIQNTNKNKQVDQYRREVQRLDIEIRRMRDMYDRQQKQQDRKYRLQIQSIERSRKDDKEEMNKKLRKKMEMMTKNLLQES